MTHWNSLSLRHSWEQTHQQLAALSEEDRRFEREKGISSWFVSFFSNADTDEIRFRKEIDRAKADLTQSNESLLKGDLPVAARKLKLAQRRLEWSYRHRGTFLAKTARGAETALPAVPIGIVGLGASALIGAVNPPLGIALGLATVGHEGVLISTNSPRDRHEGQRLIDEAQSALQAHASNKKPSLSSFLNRSEAYDDDIRNPQDLEAAWQEDMQALKARVHQETDWEKQIETMMEGLFELGLEEYSRGEAHLSSMQMFGEGNCESETKIISAAFQAMEITLPSHVAFGQQLMPKHIQAVIYNHASGKVWNLLTANKNEPLGDPIFKPELMYLAYLKGKGVTPRVTEAEILIAAPPKSLIEGSPARHFFDPYSYLTNSKLKFPRVTSNGSPGPIPERTRIENPYRTPTNQTESGLLPNQVSGIERTQPENSQIKKPEAVCVEDFPKSLQDPLMNGFSNNHIRVDFNTFSPHPDIPDNVPVFRDRKDLEQYLAISSKTDRKEFLRKMHHEDAEALLNVQEVKIARAIYEGKSVELLRNPQGILQLGEANRAITNFINLAQKNPALNNNYPSISLPLAPYFDSQKTFLKSINQNPRTFLKFFESIHWASQLTLLKKLREIDSTAMDTRQSAPNQLDNFATLRDLVLISEVSETAALEDTDQEFKNILLENQAQTGKEGLPKPEQVYEIETGLWSLPVQEAKDPEPIPTPRPKIRPHSLMNLLLGTSWLADAASPDAEDKKKALSILSLWTPAFSNKLLALNSTVPTKGFFDQAIWELNNNHVPHHLPGPKGRWTENSLLPDERALVRQDWVPILKESLPRLRPPPPPPMPEKKEATPDMPKEVQKTGSDFNSSSHSLGSW